MNRFRSTVAAVALVLVGSSAQADVISHNTRIIFPEGQREVSFRLSNDAVTPSLMQVWVDDGNEHATPANAKSPFVIRPPMFRIDGGKSQVIRILHAGEPLPTDRESLFHFNMLEAPSVRKADVEHESVMQLSIRTRLKLIYRPKGFSGEKMDKAAQQVVWTVASQGDGWVLHARNASPYFINLARIDVSVGATTKHARPEPIAPFSTHSFPLPAGTGTPSGEAVIEYVNDHGGHIPIRVRLSRT